MQTCPDLNGPIPPLDLEETSRHLVRLAAHCQQLIVTNNLIIAANEEDGSVSVAKVEGCLEKHWGFQTVTSFGSAEFLDHAFSHFAVCYPRIEVRSHHVFADLKQEYLRVSDCTMRSHGAVMVALMLKSCRYAKISPPDSIYCDQLETSFYICGKNICGKK